MTAPTLAPPYGGTVPALAAAGETAVAASAAQARAEIEASYVVARSQPRDLMAVRQRLLDDCRRPGFCEGAIYRLPRKQWDPVERVEKTIYITGPSVRFAEAALRALRNLRVSTSVLFEDDRQRICRVTVIDLEANTPLSADFVVAKTIERRKIFDKQVPIETRTGSDGQTIYIIAASESDIAMKQNAAAARARRNLVLQLLPGDILEDAADAIEATISSAEQKDPKAAIKKLVDGFARLGVSVEQMSAYIGAPIDKLSTEQWKELRDLGSAISEGSTTWSEALQAKQGEGDAGDAPQPDRASAIRASLIKALNAVRTSRPEEYAAAAAKVGIGNSPLEKADVSALRALEAALLPPTTKAQPEATNGKGS